MKTIATMSHNSYVLRGVLYFLIAALPVIAGGIEANKPPLVTGIYAVVAGCIAVRAFIDTSGSQVAPKPEAQPDGTAN